MAWRWLLLVCMVPSLAHAQSPSAALPMVVHPRATVQGTAGPAATAGTRLSSDGHFHFDALLNGVPVPMLFDTGASFIALRAEDAARMGLDISALRYSMVLSTANGPAQAAPVILASVTVGGITRTNVRAIVGRPGSQRETLLGQSFLVQLAGYRQLGDRLVLLDRE